MGSGLNRVSTGFVEKSGHVMVKLSLAIASMMPFSQAMAQIAITCQPIQYGTLADCGNGKLTVTPGGAVNTNGCPIVLGTPQPGVCKATGITSTTGSVEFQLSAKAANISVSGKTMVVSKFNIATSKGGRTKTYTSKTLTSTQLTVPIGARINTVFPQQQGSYVGSMIMTVTFTP